jgi:hypothetical protein
MDNLYPTSASKCDRCGKEYPAEELCNYYSRHFVPGSGRACPDCLSDLTMDMINAGFFVSEMESLMERDKR